MFAPGRTTEYPAASDASSVCRTARIVSRRTYVYVHRTAARDFRLRRFFERNTALIDETWMRRWDTDENRMAMDDGKTENRPRKI